MIQARFWEFYFPNVVFCDAGHTQEMLEYMRNQVALSILIMAFSS